MNKEEVALVGLEVVAYAGEARTFLLQALNTAQQKNFSKSNDLIELANKSLVQAHKSQTDMLTREARGEDVELGFIMIHAQDHLMTTMLLRDLMKHFLYLYEHK